MPSGICSIKLRTIRHMSLFNRRVVSTFFMTLVARMFLHPIGISLAEISLISSQTCGTLRLRYRISDVNTTSPYCFKDRHVQQRFTFDRQLRLAAGLKYNRQNNIARVPLGIGTRARLNIVTFVEISRARFPCSVGRELRSFVCSDVSAPQSGRGSSMAFAGQSRSQVSVNGPGVTKTTRVVPGLSLTERSLRPSALMGVSHRVKLRRRLIRIGLSDRDLRSDTDADSGSKITENR